MENNFKLLAEAYYGRGLISEIEFYIFDALKYYKKACIINPNNKDCLSAKTRIQKRIDFAEKIINEMKRQGTYEDWKKNNKVVKK